MKKLNKEQKQILALFENELRKDKKLEKELINDFRKTEKQSNSIKRGKSTKKIKRTTSRKSKRTWIERRKRTKVKSFPTKRNPKNFFYSNKKQFLLNPPLRIDDEQDLDLLEIKLNQIKPKIYKFFLEELKAKRTKSRMMNIGYQILLEFSDKNNENINSIITTSYLPTFVVRNKKSVSDNVDLILDKMLIRFEEYMNTNGFYNLEFYGLEAEIES